MSSHLAMIEHAPEQDRRQMNDLMQYWQRLCAGRLMPEENDIDPEDLGDHWSKCFLIQVFDITQRRDYNFTYLGEDIIKAYRDEVLSAGEGVIISPNASALTHSFHIVLDTCAPVLAEGEFASLSRQIIRYRQCLLPLGRDFKVDAIFGGMSFKVY